VDSFCPNWLDDQFETCCTPCCEFRGQNWRSRKQPAGLPVYADGTDCDEILRGSGGISAGGCTWVVALFVASLRFRPVRPVPSARGEILGKSTKEDARPAGGAGAWHLQSESVFIISFTTDTSVRMLEISSLVFALQVPCTFEVYCRAPNSHQTRGSRLRTAVTGRGGMGGLDLAFHARLMELALQAVNTGTLRGRCTVSAWHRQSSRCMAPAIGKCFDYWLYDG